MSKDICYKPLEIKYPNKDISPEKLYPTNQMYCGNTQRGNTKVVIEIRR